MTKQFLTICGLGLLAVTGFAQDKPAADQSALKDEREKISYAIGMSVATGWKHVEDLDVDVDTINRGIKDTMTGAHQLMTEQEMRDTLTKFSQQLRAKGEEKRRQVGEKNKAEGAAFLAANKTKPGVITLPSGLQYKIMKEGDGESPKADDSVTVNYRGTLTDGTEFDSSIKRGQPATFGVGGVIKGWTEGLQLMKTGGKWQFYIPSDLAYGERGNQSIPPNSTLVFEVELLSIAHPTPAPAPQPLTSDIIKVPSAEELKHGAKIETIKPEDIQKEMEKERAKTNK